MNSSHTQELVRDVIKRIAVGPDRSKDISQSEAQQVMSAILEGQVDPVQAAVFLIALRMKGESMEEYAGILQAMQSECSEETASVDELLYIADPFDGYVRHLPMSPFLPAVLASCGLPAIMQGVKSVGPKHGITAHQVLAKYGVDTHSDIKQVKIGLTEAGWAYYDQSVACPKLYALNQFRDLIVKRTAVTTLERVIKPIKAKQKTHLFLGYVHKAYPEIYAAMSVQSGFDSAVLVKGVEGGVTPALNKPVRSHYLSNGVMENKKIMEIMPESNYNQTTSSGVLIKDLPNKEFLVEQALETGLAMLSGKSGVARDSILLTASTVLFELKKLASIDEALEVVRHSLDNGAAMACFTKMKIKN